jgi:peptide/nickel transport system ATP-binding protein
LNPILEAEGLSVEIPVPGGMLHPVRDVALHVAAGETLCIVGESGCGKSLTALSLMGLLPQSARRNARRLTLDGQDLLTLSERRMADLRGNAMAMVFQEPMTTLNPSFTVGDQLEEALLQHRRVSRSAARERAITLLEKVGISAPESRLRQYPHQLSGGLRQRVMIAMALMCGPKVILADEPTTALDVTTQAQILRLLIALQREFRMAMVLITHDLGIVSRVADRVAVMYAGQIIEIGAVAEVYARPLHPYTQGLLRCVPVPGVVKHGTHLGFIPGIVPSLVGEPRGCSFRARCAYAMPACESTSVELRADLPGHSARCLLEPSQALRNAGLPNSSLEKFAEGVA